MEGQFGWRDVEFGKTGEKMKVEEEREGTVEGGKKMGGGTVSEGEREEEGMEMEWRREAKGSGCNTHH